MNRPRVSGAVWQLVILATFCGCGGEDGGTKKAPVVRGPKITVEKKFAEVGDPIGPLDGGRINVPPPEGWTVAPRSSDWIIRFKGSRLPYPSIFVTAEDFETVFNVVESNADVFKRQLAEAIEADPKAGKVRGSIESLRAGDLLGATYTRHARVKVQGKKVVVERLFVDTVVDGRKYTFELRARMGTTAKYRPALMAVASGTEFLTRSAAGPDDEPIDDPLLEPIEELPGKE